MRQRVPARHFDFYLEKALTVAFLTNLKACG
jgi:hypothetical protein